MVSRNSFLNQLAPSYLFPEIQKRKAAFLKSHPDAKLISLGIGDTTEPLSLKVGEALSAFSLNLTTSKGYQGYGCEQGSLKLREMISQEIYHNKIPAEEIFISDGAKCDLGRLQALFGGSVSIAIQDPAYPVYLDGSLIQGVREIEWMSCNPENHFFPDLNQLKRTDLIYFCSPNNPTGVAYTIEQLKALVDFARKNRSIIIFDSAYAGYIQEGYPKTIYEIEGADEVAIEVNSFSKLAGFSGIRLGWTVVPTQLKYDDGKKIIDDWRRVTCTIFNGASILVQEGGYAVLKEKCRESIPVYLENARLLKEALRKKGQLAYGGEHAPYLWVHFPNRSSWDLFEAFLEKLELITTPGSGFGKAGEGFIRLSALGHRKEVEEAVKRLEAFNFDLL